MKTVKIALLDYGVGNLFSVANALRAVGADVVITQNLTDIQAADKILLPGVGAIKDAMHHMQKAKIDIAVKESV